MDKVYLYSGILIGLAFMQALITISKRQRKKPYHTAFAILTFYQSGLLFIECNLGIELNINTVSPAVMCCDLLIIPLFFLEVLCITNQNMTELSWTKRWLHTGLIAIPIFCLMIYCLVEDAKTYNGKILTFVVAYLLAVFVLTTHLLYKFRTLLKRAKTAGDQDVKWVNVIIVIMNINLILYLVYESLPHPIIYYGASFLIIITHGYFIRKQAPTNMRKLLIMNKELVEEQKEAIEELKDATKVLKRRLDMDTALKAFHVTHPMFEPRLREKAHVKLTRRDIYLCTLIYEGKRIPEIADCLGISPSSVEVARHRLRNKLNLEKGKNLNSLLQDIDKS